MGALQNGDYLELLNLFPLEGVHLTLRKLVLTGVSGWNGVAQLLLQVRISGVLFVCEQYTSVLMFCGTFGGITFGGITSSPSHRGCSCREGPQV